MTFFSNSPELSQLTTSFTASFLIHSSVFGLLAFSILSNPPIVNDAHSKRYSVRHVNLHSRAPQFQLPPTAANIGPSNETISAGTQSASQRIADRVQASLQLGATLGTAEQTILQPDLSSQIAPIRKMQVPTFAIWQHSQVPVTMIVPSLPEKPTSIAITFSFSVPNKEFYQQDFRIVSPDLPAQRNPFPAGTTSPVTVHKADSGRFVPSTVSQDSSRPTPVAIASLSNLLITDGIAIVPPVNETATSQTNHLTAPGRSRTLSTDDMDRTDEKHGNGQGRPDSTQNSSRQGLDAHREQNQGNVGSPAEHNIGLQTKEMSATPINLSKTGRFDSVVVGSSLADQFPEIEGLWNDRLTYTAYLHVGLPNSWILQFSLPESDPAAGNINHLGAPWPYSILRPDLAPAATPSDALIFHGFIGLDGRFEAVTLVFPSSFTEAHFVINCLTEWQFRPATQDGKVTRVEVLLVIPQDLQ